MSKPQAAYIEVHVFGGETEGECIVLKMPDGSSGAYSNELEAAVFLSDRKSDAVVTGYRKSRLPTQHVLESLKTFSNSLAITHSRHLKPKSIANPDESRRALAEAFSLVVENTTESRTALNAVFSVEDKGQSASVGQCSCYVTVPHNHYRQPLHSVSV